ncbi:MAG: F0F1 ATP synthase subunit B, partial [Planctomycetia bacterium]|nr:F0F1 ATP synthase subunit B [Planctomycetia bacterium]
MRFWVTLSIIIGTAAAPAILLPPACVAAEDAVHAEAERGAHDTSVPSMTMTKKDTDLAIWSAITFIVFLAVLRKFAWGPLIAGLDKREQSVLDHLANAEAARIKAEKMLADHAAKLDKVQDKVREILAEAKRDAEHTKADIMSTAQKEGEATRQRAVHDIERARDQALDELLGHMGRAVSAATEQVLG